MPRRMFVFDPPDRFVAGTVGQPGQRTFFLQARKAGQVVSVILEKVQVAVLAERLDALLDELESQGVADTPAAAPTAIDSEPLDEPINVNPRYYQRTEEIAFPALVHTEMRLEHFGRVHFFVAELRFAQNFRLQFELHELLDAPALHQHLWSFFVNRYAQLVLLRKKNCPLLRRELEPGLIEQSPKLSHLLLR
jgi:hypothetical protein